METPILRTKVYVPQPQSGSLIPPPSLLEKLDQGLERRLILISAPAGSGKTTLLSQRLNESSLHPYCSRPLGEEKGEVAELPQRAAA